MAVVQALEVKDVIDTMRHPEVTPTLVRQGTNPDVPVRQVHFDTTLDPPALVLVIDAVV